MTEQQLDILEMLASDTASTFVLEGDRLMAEELNELRDRRLITVGISACVTQGYDDHTWRYSGVEIHPSVLHAARLR